MPLGTFLMAFSAIYIVWLANFQEIGITLSG